MKEPCNQSLPLCSCADRSDFSELLEHMMQNFRFDHFELEYHTLAPEAERRLCLVGACGKCAKRLCYGTELPENEPPEQLLESICAWTHQVWRFVRSDLPDNADSFQKVFLELFHAEDRAFVRDWLGRPENQVLIQPNRCSRKEGC